MKIKLLYNSFFFAVAKLIEQPGEYISVRLGERMMRF
jgi:hypothetical protein